MSNKPLVLIVLDGWGYREPADDNAISVATTPTWDELMDTCPHSLLETSGPAVGLPEGQMGNSEVGHMNIGAGRVVYQDITRITRAIENGEFFDNDALCNCVDAAVQRGRAVHVMGLLSPGGVHSHNDHFLATVELAAGRSATRINVHAFLDGRDTPPRSARPSIDRMQGLLDGLDGAAFATIAGRYYAMDRDQRWERTERAWRAVVDARADFTEPDAATALEAAYARDEGDEFVQPTVIDGYPGMDSGDSVIFINFRADRARQLTRAFSEPGFDDFVREAPKLSALTTMTEYLAGLPVDVAFPKEALPDILGEVISRNGLKQFRIAETEKYAHVTFFFNGGREEPFANEERLLIPSPKVATYDMQPEMSAPKVADELAKAIRNLRSDVMVCNLANPDMVGHTGNMDAAVRAVEAVDASLATVCAALDETGGELLVTSDHGNVEQMTDPKSGQKHTAHTTNPVPFVYRGSRATVADKGTLRDIAPTILHLLGLPQPEAMTGRSLLRLVDRRRSVA